VRTIFRPDARPGIGDDQFDGPLRGRIPARLRARPEGDPAGRPNRLQGVDTEVEENLL
jgi:hypothetical protein